MRGGFLILTLVTIGLIGGLIYYQYSPADETEESETPVTSYHEAIDMAAQLRENQEVAVGSGLIWLDNADRTSTTAVEDKPEGPETPTTSGFQPDEIRKREAERREQREAAKTLDRPTALTGKTIPFRIILTPGWKILNPDDPVVVSYGDDFTVTLETGPWNTSQREFAEKTLDDLAAHYPDIPLVEQDLIELDGKTWARFHLRESTTVLTNPRELLVMTYGSRQGSYRIIIGGRSRELNDAVDVISRLLGSFRFPPNNFKPEGTSSVRVYVDGERWYF